MKNDFCYLDHFIFFLVKLFLRQFGRFTCVGCLKRPERKFFYPKKKSFFIPICFGSKNRHFFDLSRTKNNDGIFSVILFLDMIDWIPIDFPPHLGVLFMPKNLSCLPWSGFAFDFRLHSFVEKERKKREDFYHFLSSFFLTRIINHEPSRFETRRHQVSPRNCCVRGVKEFTDKVSKW